MMTKRTPHLLAYALFGAIAATYFLLAALAPIGYIWATYEDLFGEWAQFWGFVVTLVLSLCLVGRTSRYRLFFGILALSCFYVAMEEISWGQRLIGFSSPAYFKAHNLQNEANLHNFFTGPYRTTLKLGITYVLAAALAAYGAAYPLMLRRRWRVAAWLDARGLPAPPLQLWPFFVCAAVLELGPFGFNEAEVAELMVGLALVMMTAHYLVAHRHGLRVHGGEKWTEPHSRCLGRYMGVGTLAVAVLAVFTTLAVYASPTGRERIEKRVRNGVEKFARRYARWHRWDTAAGLYHRVLKEEPRSTSNLRKLADVYRQSGDTERFNQYIHQALAVGAARYRKNRKSTSAHRSLALTYRMMGDEKLAAAHLREALTIALDRVRRRPGSASAAYSLGRTYELIGRFEPAKVQFKRAVKLKPASKKYRKAFFRIQRKL